MYRWWKGKRARAKTDDNPIEMIYPAMWLSASWAVAATRIPQCTENEATGERVRDSPRDSTNLAFPMKMNSIHNGTQPWMERAKMINDSQSE